MYNRIVHFYDETHKECSMCDELKRRGFHVATTEEMTIDEFKKRYPDQAINNEDDWMIPNPSRTLEKK